MIVLVQVVIKDAANCDKHCDLQISVNKLAFERIVQLWNMPDVGLGSCLCHCCAAWGVVHACNMSMPVCVNMSYGIGIALECATLSNEHIFCVMNVM